MLTINDLSKDYGGRVLFENANLQLDSGHRYGIVGANGSGKSTLLRILTGEESASSGEVQRRRRARVGVLDQDHFKYEETSILEVVMMGNSELWEAMKERDDLLENAHDEFDDDKYTRLEEIVMRYDGYSLEARSSEILEGLNIPTEVHREPMRVLSGGFKLRALLGQVLAAQPEVLLLDEPTNHLDILSIQWLESFLQSYRGCAVVVSHDHRFLDRVCTNIIDVDYQRVIAYKGNYESFLKQKEETRTRAEGEIAKREKEIAHHKDFIRRFKAKASKARQANSRQKQVDKMVIETLPQTSRRHPNFKLKARRQSGREVLKVDGIWKAYGDNSVLEEVSLKVERGDKLAIIGANGIGKSTLLKILVDELDADAGEFKWGFEADFGYFPQDHKSHFSDPNQTVMGWMWDSKPEQSIGYVHGKLAEVLFTKDDVDKLVSNISGGEASRLLFARLGVNENTVLVLDEPTNHLDMEGIESLAAGLKRYDGTVLFVSHDRWFVDQVASRIIEIKVDGIEDFHGRYSEYLAKGLEDHLDAEQVAAKAREEKRAAKKARKKERSNAKQAETNDITATDAEDQPENRGTKAGKNKKGNKGKKGRKNR
jgi:ATPase subunit of ABC transporter with duplicated ATPase domains